MSENIEFRSEAQIAEIELHKAAIHEAGHLVVLQAFGGLGFFRVWRNTSREPDEKAWRGRLQILGKPGEVSMTPEAVQSMRATVPPPDRWRVLLGMAGFVAECIYGGDSDPDSIFNDLCDAFEDEISDTDAEEMGSDWSIEDVTATAALLLDRWQLVLVEAAAAREAAIWNCDDEVN